MKNPETKRPTPLSTAACTCLVVMMIVLFDFVGLIAAYNAHAQINYTFGAWLVSLLFIGALILIMRLACVAEDYIWEYLALCKLLKQKGLGSWIKEAQKIQTLK